MGHITRRGFLATASGACAGALAGTTERVAHAQEDNAKRPNILFAIADDWSWPHASIAGAPGIQTPTFDRVAREGCLFSTAFAAAPQCSPNRAATLTGRAIWQIEEAGTHASIFPNKFLAYPDLLEEQGYHVGYTGKPWGPGDWERGGWKRNPAGPEYNAIQLDTVPADGIRKLDYVANFQAFLADRPNDAPFCFWFGCSEPHRRYEEGSGLKAGKKLEDAPVPPFLPDDPIVRGDILDYFVEVEWFDSQVGAMLNHLEATGQLDNTLVVVTSDNGMPFPSAKANLFEYGIHMPLAIRWPERVEAGTTIDTPVSFIDFAPTFLDAAGVPIPEAMTGKSFLPELTGAGAPHRDHVLAGRERHTHARYDNLGFPARCIRTGDYLYIRNFKPDRWPAGDPPEFHDIDGSPTKTFLLSHQEQFPEMWQQAVGRRPKHELYDIVNDPGCLHNLAETPEYKDTLEKLGTTLLYALAGQDDPRVLGTGDIFDSYPRVSGMRPELGGFAERGEYNPKYQP